MKNPKAVIELFVISFIFMLLFQIESRLISYIYFFHEGLILIESLLLGSGIFLILSMNKKVKRVINPNIDSYILLASLVQIFLLFRWHYFFIDMLFLSILFGLIFFKITNYIWLSPNKFYFLDLFGSVLGIVVYIIFVKNFLDEIFLPIIGLILLINSLKNRNISLKIINCAILTYFIFLTINLTFIQLIHFNPNINTYKTYAYDDKIGLVPVTSFTDLKGRTDLFLYQNINHDQFNTLSSSQYITLRSTGYYVMESFQNDFIKNKKVIQDPRIPIFDFKENSKVLIIGSSIGSNIQAYSKYIKNPQITAIDIDKIMEKVYRTKRFDMFLPNRSNFELKIIDGRRYAELSNETFDVIFIAGESINSMDILFVDERTSHLVTKEAITKYLSMLNKGGYIIIEQYHPNYNFGDKILDKLLNTIQEAESNDISNNLLIYSFSFGYENNSMRFALVCYKKDNFSNEDKQNYYTWFNDYNSIPTKRYNITYYNKTNPKYSSFFNTSKRKEINELIISDDKPFRHNITFLPFPTKYYYYYLAFLIIFLGFLYSKKPKSKNIYLSALIGIIVFGMQYLLFYKTAAFLHTSLVFFSVYLIIPLLFGSFGGYLSKNITKKQIAFLTILFTIFGIYLANVNIFKQNIYVVFFMITTIFFYLGLFFPKILKLAKKEREIIYATNIFFGGLAFLLVITLHATIGWTLTFYIVMLMTLILIKLII